MEPRPAISAAFMSVHCDNRHWDAWHRVVGRLWENEALLAWLAQHLDFSKSEGFFLEINDAEKVFARMQPRSPVLVFAYKVPFSRLEGVADLDAEFKTIAQELYTTWAQRRGIPGPPPL